MHPDLTDSTSPTLIARVQRRDEEAWSRFVKLYAPLVYRWGRIAGLKPQDVADVTQEVFRVLATKIDTFDGERKANGSFRSWLWGISRIAVLNHFRASGKSPLAEGGTAALLRLHELHDDLHEEMEESESVKSLHMLLRQALGLLENEFEPKTWQAFWRLATEGQSAAHIGNDLGMTAKAVRQAKYRVLRRLRDELGSDYADIHSFSEIE